MVLHTGGLGGSCTARYCAGRGFGSGLDQGEKLVGAIFSQQHRLFQLTICRSSSSAPDDGEYLIGGALSPKYFATTGAFNGSGIAVASQSFSSSTSNGNSGALVMYFQHVSLGLYTKLDLS